jgi:hypothetical protein
MFFLDVSTTEGEDNVSLLNVVNGLPSEAAPHRSAAETLKLAIFLVVYWIILDCIRYFIVICLN